MWMDSAVALRARLFSPSASAVLRLAADAPLARDDLALLIRSPPLRRLRRLAKAAAEARHAAPPSVPASRAAVQRVCECRGMHARRHGLVQADAPARAAAAFASNLSAPLEDHRHELESAADRCGSARGRAARRVRAGLQTEPGVLAEHHHQRCEPVELA